MADKVQFIPVNKIKMGERFRRDLGDLSSLKGSINEKGVLQPITVRVHPLEPDNFELMAGGRRLTCVIELQIPKIPALIRDSKETLDDVDLREVELIENVFRKDFEWDEQAKLIAEIDKLCREKHGTEWGTRKTAALLGQSHHMNVVRAKQLVEAMEYIPDLSSYKTADEAMKMVKKFEESVVHNELRKRQETSKDKGLLSTIMLAKSNYKLGDAIKGMEAFPNNSPAVDFIEVDPPYGIDLVAQKKQADATSIVKSYNEIPNVEYQAFVEILAEEAFRVANVNAWMIFWYGPTHHAMIFSALVAAGWSVDEIPAIWSKGSGQTNAPEVHLARSYEPFFVCRKGRPALHQRGRANVFNFSPVAGTKKYHPTERPMSLMMEILDVFTWPGASSVMIPFLGSGVTLRACYMYGCKGFGWDLNPEYKDRFLLAVEDDTKLLNAATEAGDAE